VLASWVLAAVDGVVLAGAVTLAVAVLLVVSLLNCGAVAVRCTGAAEAVLVVITTVDRALGGDSDLALCDTVHARSCGCC